MQKQLRIRSWKQNTGNIYACMRTYIPYIYILHTHTCSKVLKENERLKQQQRKGHELRDKLMKSYTLEITRLQDEIYKMKEANGTLSDLPSQIKKKRTRSNAKIDVDANDNNDDDEKSSKCVSNSTQLSLPDHQLPIQDSLDALQAHFLRFGTLPPEQAKEEEKEIPTELPTISEAASNNYSSINIKQQSKNENKMKERYSLMNPDKFTDSLDVMQAHFIGSGTLPNENVFEELVGSLPKSVDGDSDSDSSESDDEIDLCDECGIQIDGGLHCKDCWDRINNASKMNLIE